MDLSVVVADRCGAVPEMTAALARELEPTGDEVVWVRCRAGAPDHRASHLTVVDGPPQASRGEANALGLARATRAVVAFTDAETVLCPGWRAALLRAMEGGAQVVGGPVLPSRPRTVRSWAGFFVEYGPHAVAPFTSASGDVAGNNVAYRRSLLDGLTDGAVWKTVVNDRLAASGIRPRVDSEMRVTSTKQYTWRDLGPVRVRHGRLYASQRAVSWSLPRRVLAAIGCVGLPLLASARTAARVRHESPLHAPLAASFPLVLLAWAAWSVGEATGYLKRNPDGRGLW